MSEKFNIQHIAIFRNAFARFAIGKNLDIIHRKDLVPLLESLTLYPTDAELEVIMKKSHVTDQELIPFAKFLDILSVNMIYSAISYMGTKLSEDELHDLLQDISFE